MLVLCLYMLCQGDRAHFSVGMAEPELQQPACASMSGTCWSNWRWKPLLGVPVLPRGERPPHLTAPPQPLPARMPAVSIKAEALHVERQRAGKQGSSSQVVEQGFFMGNYPQRCLLPQVRTSSASRHQGIRAACNRVTRAPARSAWPLPGRLRRGCRRPPLRRQSLRAQSRPRLLHRPALARPPPGPPPPAGLPAPPRGP